MTTAVCERMPGHIETYRVLIGDGVKLGFIRLDRKARKWVARTLGTDRSAADLRKFDNRISAIHWLAEREPAPGCGKRRNDNLH